MIATRTFFTFIIQALLTVSLVFTMLHAIQVMLCQAHGRPWADEAAAGSNLANGLYEYPMGFALRDITTGARRKRLFHMPLVFMNGICQGRESAFGKFRDKGYAVLIPQRKVHKSQIRMVLLRAREGLGTCAGLDTHLDTGPAQQQFQPLPHRRMVVNNQNTNPFRSHLEVLFHLNR